MAGSRIYREHNTLVLQGSFGLQDLHTLLAKLHQAVQVVIDRAISQRVAVGLTSTPKKL